MTAPAPEMCLMLAAERSGTHFLRSMLAKAKGVAAPGEICNGAAEEIRTSEMSYLKFRENACLKDRDFFYPTNESQARLLDDYFAHVRAINKGRRYVILDVKYSHVHNFSGFWWDITSRPFLLNHAAKRSIKIIHLVRERVFQTAISEIYAQESGVWRAQHAKDLAAPRITVDAARLKNKTRQLLRTIGFFEGWLNQCPAVRIGYEELTADGPACLARLAAFLKLEGEIPLASDFIKTTPPYEDVVENFADIKDLIDRDLSSARELLFKK